MANGWKIPSRGIEKCSAEDVYSFMSSHKEGLTQAEVKSRQNTYGPNRLNESKNEAVWLTFIKNFTSMMAILLWAGGLVAFLTETPQLGIAIWSVNVINGLFSFFQEYRASRATEALKKMLPSYVRVLRDGREDQILAEELVPGDIMLIEEGDKISADGRVVFETDLQVNQSALTGESNPVRKMTTPILDNHITPIEFNNMVFAGTSVSNGSGKVVVSQIGMATEFGKIAHLTQSMSDEKSPLQKELDHLTKQISMIAVSIGLFFFVAAVVFVKEPLAQAFIFALGMVVAFIPEGLLPTVTLSLAMAVQRMAKDHALVKKLSSVETLGATSVICSDKTGTLTQNEMTVNHVWTRRQEYQVTGLGYTPEGSIKTSNDIVELSQDSTLEYLVRFAALCSNAKVIEPDEQHSRYSVLGDPTEACLIVLAKKAGLSLLDNENWAKRIRELPFDSSRKRMTTIHQLSRSFQSTSYLAISKGSPKELVDLCPWIMDKGIVRPMMEEDRAAIMQANDAYARQGLRVLAVAYRDLEKANSLPTSVSDYTPELIEYDLVFMGLVAMSDPPREEVAAAVAKCHDASIRIIMVTGDYGLTAVSIAKRIGIVRGDSPRVVTGAELKRMSDEELRQVLLDEVIFARVAPEQKYRVVSQLQALGHVVAVTGDGVNDAPALKKADIGVAMGITGTDVAKESADMILTDDNFASIVKAVEEGRAVYYNIQKFLTYIFNSNTSEAVPSAAFLFSRGAIPLPLTVMQILAIDLGTDMLPALGLGVEKPEEGLMSRPPRNISDPLLHLELLIKAFVWYGLMEAGLAMGAFFFTSIGHQVSLSQLLANDFLYRQATTMTLGAIIFCQLGMVLNCRTLTQSVFKLKLFSNVTINLGMVFEIVLFASLTYLPVLNSLFHTAPLSMWQWGYLFLCPLPILGIEEVRKAYLRHRST